MILSLHHIQLDAPLNLSGTCIVLTELILPRNGIAKKSALKEVPLKQGKRNLQRQPFYEKAVLKEKVVGLVGLKVSITRPLKHAERTRFLRQLLAAGLESSVDLISLSNANLSELVSDVLDEAVDQWADNYTDDDPSFLASGGIDLDTEALHSGPVSIDLKLEKSLRRSQHTPGPKAREQRKAKSQQYRKGLKVGQITLDLMQDA
jgi:hypothetical protein